MRWITKKDDYSNSEKSIFLKLFVKKQKQKINKYQL
jgi:hypothetical protein